MQNEIAHVKHLEQCLTLSECWLLTFHAVKKGKHRKEWKLEDDTGFEEKTISIQHSRKSVCLESRDLGSASSSATSKMFALSLAVSVFSSLK